MSVVPIDINWVKETAYRLRKMFNYFKENFEQSSINMSEYAVKGSGGVYIVTLAPDGTYLCTCPYFKHVSLCKHGELITTLMTYKLIKAKLGPNPAILLTHSHTTILNWMKNHNISGPMEAITCRQLIDKMQADGMTWKDRTYSGRVSELYSHGYLKVLEIVMDNERLPGDAHYYPSEKGMAVAL